jgi:hypothetical protein
VLNIGRSTCEDPLCGDHVSTAETTLLPAPDSTAESHAAEVRSDQITYTALQACNTVAILCCQTTLTPGSLLDNAITRLATLQPETAMWLFRLRFDAPPADYGP